MLIIINENELQDTSGHPPAVAMLSLVAMLTEPQHKTVYVQCTCAHTVSAHWVRRRAHP